MTEKQSQNSQKMRRIFEDRTAALGVSESGSGRGKVTLPRPENASYRRKVDGYSVNTEARRQPNKIQEILFGDKTPRKKKFTRILQFVYNCVEVVYKLGVQYT